MNLWVGNLVPDIQTPKCARITLVSCLETQATKYPVIQRHIPAEQVRTLANSPSGQQYKRTFRFPAHLPIIVVVQSLQYVYFLLHKAFWPTGIEKHYTGVKRPGRWLTFRLHLLLLTEELAVDLDSALWKSTVPWFWPQTEVFHLKIHKAEVIQLLAVVFFVDRLCGLVVRVSGYRHRGLGFDFRRYQIFWVVVGLERGPLSLVRSIEELLE